ncbi:hypothetical protein GXB81_08765 [Paraburkholderia sp. Ac-20336]|uniref:hypothetical protein n=1 Tax=Paraburkholderia sp. Ac-20336 TaxID=2703886 RepID=UPI001981BC41|nr:hypothetical protein [Paraburkholderia sp. Ac-20336]MBN3803144.1 hypothetical protein [Paraburkholderia sp. Ac-20336]
MNLFVAVGLSLSSPPIAAARVGAGCASLAAKRRFRQRMFSFCIPIQHGACPLFRQTQRKKPAIQAGFDAALAKRRVQFSDTKHNVPRAEPLTDADKSPRLAS